VFDLEVFDGIGLPLVQEAREPRAIVFGQLGAQLAQPAKFRFAVFV